MARKWIVLAIVCIMLASSAVALNSHPSGPFGLPAGLLPDEPSVAAAAVSAVGGDGKLLLTLSETGHFFEKGVEVAVTASVADAKIYYTTDGSEPTSDSREYSEPLRFLAPMAGAVSVTTLKAIAVHGGAVTRPLAHTFFIGGNVSQRFDTLIFSLSTDVGHLYDYDTGIFVEGRLRDEYIKENGRGNIIPPDPANFNWRGMEGERPVYAEVFTPDGKRVIAQAAGIRVHGAWSRAASQKSIRLVARREYEPEAGKFDFDFFPDDLVCDKYGSPLTRYDQLILRNGGNDREFGMLRHEVGCHLALQAGLRVATPARPAAVFINGEYYGFAWLNARINGKYLQDIYNAPTADFQIVGRGELWIDTEDEDEREAVELMNSYIWRGFTDDKVFAEFEELVDVDNLLLYYAFQTYMGNNDWPGGNMRRWRYTGPQTEGLAPELDGRWRYVTYDVDWTLGLYDNPSNPNKPTFQEMMNKNSSRHSYMLIELLKRPDMADKFSMIMCDLMANVVTEENVRETIEKLYGEARNEIGAALAAYKYANWVGEHTIAENHRNMQTFARGRGAYITKSLRDQFDYGFDMFDVEVAGGEAVIGTQKGTSSRYFAHLTVPLRPVLPKFTAFDHWIVNGDRRYEPEITVSAADARGGAVTVELVTKEEIPPLVFAEAYASSARSGCILVNPDGETARVAGLFLSNDPQNPFLWALPDVAVAPGGTVGLAGKGSNAPDDLLLIRMGFNVRQGRMIYLSDAEGRVLDTITVP